MPQRGELKLTLRSKGAVTSWLSPWRLAVMALVGAIAALASPASGQVEVGRHHATRIATPHWSLPSSTSLPSWEVTLSHPGATYIAVHFEVFDLAPGARVVISSPDDPDRFTFTGRGVQDRGSFWATHVYGDEARIEVFEETAGSSFGFVIDRYSAGFADLHALMGGEESICGTDDKVNAICHRWSDPLAYDRARSVGALLSHWDASDPGLDRFCTGALVACGDLFLTNEHCVPGVATAANATYEFMAEAPACGDPNPPEIVADPAATDPPHPGTRFTGGVLLASDFALDYALIRIDPDPVLGSPNALFGSLGVDDRTAVPGEPIYIPQHAAGRGKQLGILSTDPNDASGRCEVFSTSEPGCGARPGPDVGYFCDTEPGSSGSPVLAESSHRILALHHCARCPNRGVPIEDILDNLAIQGITLTEPLPGEVPAWQPDPLRVTKGPNQDQVSVTWSGALEADWSNVYRGTLDSLWNARTYDHAAGPGAGACDRNLLFLDDVDDLTDGNDYYYLVTGENPCGEGPTGFDSFNAPRPAGSGC